MGNFVYSVQWGECWRARGWDRERERKREVERLTLIFWVLNFSSFELVLCTFLPLGVLCVLPSMASTSSLPF